MDRVRYECRLSTGGAEYRFWADDTDQILGLVGAVVSGAQVRNSMRLVVVDTACGNARVSCTARSSLGFGQVAESMMNAMNAAQMPPHRPEQSRDVTVEVHFAALGCRTLEQCRDFAGTAISEALDREYERVQQGEGGVGGLPSFQYNGQTVGEGWFNA